MTAGDLVIAFTGGLYAGLVLMGALCSSKLGYPSLSEAALDLEHRLAEVFEEPDALYVMGAGWQVEAAAALERARGP